MTSLLISFGQAHTHKINNKLFHNNVICKLSSSQLDFKGLRTKAFELFGQRWSFSYPVEKASDPEFMRHFPEGIVELEV